MRAAAAPTGRERIRQVMLSLPVLLVLTTASAGLGPAIANSAGNAKITFVLLLILVALTLAWTGKIRQGALGGWKGVAERIAVRVTGSGQLVLPALRKVCCAKDADSAEDALRDLTGLVLQTARYRCGRADPETNRAAIFVFESSGDLIRKDWHGRSAPRERWRVADSNDRMVVTWANTQVDVVADRVDDVRKEKTRGAVDLRASYVSYISIPVVSNGSSYGMLTVDSPTPGNFNPIDTGTLELLAYILGAGIAHARIVGAQV